VIAYELRDAAGTLVAVHERHDGPDGKRFVFRQPDGRLGLGGVRTADLPLYGSHLLNGATTVVVAEGEKAADALLAAGIPAVGTVCGASTIPGPDALAVLEGRAVLLWPDNDDAGRRHMDRIAAELVDRAVVAAVDWPEAPPKGDAADYVADHDRAALDALLATATAVLPPPEPTIGIRTALDLVFGPPPRPLADPFCTEDGATVVYARGGTGKGLVACWLISRMVRAGHVVLVLDFEGHAREWGSRLRGLGLTDDELGVVHYRAPFDAADWTAESGALSDIADAIRADADRLGATFVVVDSYSVATSNGDTMGGESAAREYFGALVRIGRPSLTIAHVRGDSGRFPDRPFGSVFVHNLARETWAVERIEAADDGDAEAYAPAVVALELRNRKANGRPMAPAQFVTFSIFADGTTEVTTDRPRNRSVADLAADALADGPLTLPKLRTAIAEDTGQDVDTDTLGRTLRRNRDRFEASAKRPRTWNVRPANRTTEIPMPGVGVRFRKPDTPTYSNRTRNRTAREREPDNEPDKAQPDTRHAHEPDTRTLHEQIWGVGR
jgi:hypothetical protein